MLPFLDALDQECWRWGSSATRILLRLRTCQRSYCACMRNQTSGEEVPKAAARRTAISGETAALPLRTREKVTRPTPRCLATAETVISPRYSRMTSPGCGGLYMRMALSPLVIVLVIDQDGVFAFKSESE